MAFGGIVSGEVRFEFEGYIIRFAIAVIVSCLDFSAVAWRFIMFFEGGYVATRDFADIAVESLVGNSVHGGVANRMFTALNSVISCTGERAGEGSTPNRTALPRGADA